MPAVLRTSAHGTLFDCSNLDTLVFYVAAVGSNGVTFQSQTNPSVIFTQWSNDNGNTWNNIHSIQDFFNIPGINGNDYTQVRRFTISYRRTIEGYVRKSFIDRIQSGSIYTMRFSGSTNYSSQTQFDTEYFSNAWDAFIERLGYRKTFVSTTQPTSTTAGDAWFNPATDQFYIYEE